MNSETEKLSNTYEKFVEEEINKDRENNKLNKVTLKCSIKDSDSRIFKGRFAPLSNVSTNISDNNSNPFMKFESLKTEIDMIEKDLEFYKNNKELFESKFKYSFSNAYEELIKLKKISEFVNNSDNYKILKYIVKKHGPDVLENKDIISLLNSKMYDKTNQKLLNNMNLINELKDSKINNFDDLSFELYLTPDTEQIKMFSQIVEIQKQIEDLQEKIGKYDFESKKQTLSEVVVNIKHNLKLFDKDYQKELNGKFEILKKKLEEITSGKHEFYKGINKQRIDGLYKNIESGKNLEDIIFKTLESIDSQRQNHENTACIFVKINEVHDLCEKMLVQLDEEIEVVDNLKNSIKSNNKSLTNNLELLNKKISQIIK